MGAFDGIANWVKSQYRGYDVAANKRKEEETRKAIEAATRTAYQRQKTPQAKRALLSRAIENERDKSWVKLDNGTYVQPKSQNNLSAFTNAAATNIVYNNPLSPKAWANWYNSGREAIGTWTGNEGMRDAGTRGLAERRALESFNNAQAMDQRANFAGNAFGGVVNAGTPLPIPTQAGVGFNINNAPSSSRFVNSLNSLPGRLATSSGRYGATTAADTGFGIREAGGSEMAQQAGSAATGLTATLMGAFGLGRLGAPNAGSIAGKQTAAQIARNIAVSGNAEGLEELVEGGVDDLVARATYDKNRSIGQTLQNLGAAYTTGLVSGGALGGVNARYGGQDGNTIAKTDTIKARQKTPNVSNTVVKNDPQFKQHDSDITRYLSLADQTTGKEKRNYQQAAKEALRLRNARRAELTQGGFLGGERATGYKDAEARGRVFEGLDGKPRFEVDDSGAKLNTQAISKAAMAQKNGEAYLKLGEALDHPELYKQYPKLKDASVTFTSGGRNNGVFYVDREGNYQFKINSDRDIDAQLKTMLHEVQHGIQRTEGFARGGDNRQFLNDIYQKNKSIMSELDEINAQISQEAKNGRTPEYMNLLERRGEIVKRLNETQDRYGSVEGKSIEEYQKLAGEAEARAVASRMNMSDGERYKMPDNAVYHGTGAEFDAFSDSFRGTATKSESAKRATFFTDSREVAQGYADYAADDAVVNKMNERVRALEDKARRTRSQADWDAYDKAVIEQEKMATYDSIQNRLKNSKVKAVTVDGDFLEVDAQGKTPSELAGAKSMDSWLNAQLDKAQSQGKVGVKFVNLDDTANGVGKASTHYAVFDNKNIKPANPQSTFYDSLDVPKEDLIIRDGGGKAMSVDSQTPQTPKRSQLSGQALSTRSRDIGKALGMTDQQMQEAANTEENLLQTNQQGLEQLENRSLTTKSSQPAFRIRSSQTAENATKEASTNLQSQEIKAIPSDDSITQSVNEQINHPQIPKRNKANVIDYFRTPQRVLEKIGLADAGKALVEADRAYKKELPTQIEKITQWYERIGNSNEASTRIFKYLDGQKGAKAKLQGNELEVANEMKAYLAEWADRLNLPKDGRVTNYITHIFEDQLIEKDFDPDLARLIDDKVPGSVYDPFTQQRLGAKGYVEDAIRALDAYTKRAVRKANMDPALDVLKKQADTLDVESWKYVKRLGDRINMRPTEMDNLLDNLVKASPIGYRLGSRPTARVTQAIRKATYRATLGLNVGSAVRNLTQGINTFAELGGQYTGVGYTKVIGNMFNGGNAELEQVGVLDNSFIEDRTLSAKHKAAQRMDKVLFAAFEKAEQINRGAAYFGAKQKALKAGKSEADAVNAGIEAARKTQFTFGRVETPIALQGDINKLFTQFQSYNVKQAEFVGGMISNKEYAKMARYTIATLAVFALMSKALGYRPEDMIPFGSNIKDGKLPIATAPAFRVIPEAVDFGKAVFSTPSEGAKTPKNEKVVEAAKDFGAAIGSSSIPGFVQAKKTYGGVKAFRDGEMERYGEGTVQIEQTPQNFVKGAVFGPYALKTTEQPTQPTVKTKDRQAQVTTAPSNSWENLVTNYNDETLRKGMTDTEKTIAKTLNDLPQGISEEARNELVKYARLTPDGRKKVYNDMNNELKLKYAEFERDKISGTLTSAEEFKAAKDIAKLEIGTKYGQEAYDMYSLAKYEIENLATPEMYNRLLAYDMELYERGLISSPKLDENKDRVKRSSGGVKTALKSAIAYATPEQISVPSVRTAQAPTRKLRIPTIQTGGGGAPKGRKYTVKVAKLS